MVLQRSQEYSRIVLGGNGDVRILNVLNDSSLVGLCGHGMPVFSCHTVPVCSNMPTLLNGS